MGYFPNYALCTYECMLLRFKQYGKHYLTIATLEIHDAYYHKNMRSAKKNCISHIYSKEPKKLFKKNKRSVNPGQKVHKRWLLVAHP